MRHTITRFIGLAALFTAGSIFAQPPGITMEMISRQLPLEGAPEAVPGPYQTVREYAANKTTHLLIRPRDLTAFPASDNMPLVVWGNGGCAIDGTRYGDFLATIASHGFLVMTTVPAAGMAPGQSTADNMWDAINWATAENARAGSSLQGKIDLDNIAVMGQSCGGFMSASVGVDERIGTVGMFNSGLAAPGGPSPFPSNESLAELKGPVLLINGGEVDFMYETSHENFELIDHVPVFYGARDNAGHTATVFHPGGGEYANVASNWLKYTFKGDAEAGRMFVGENCSLCRDPLWETDSKGLE